MERIVSGQFPQLKEVETSSKEKEKGRQEGQIVRMGTVKRMRELVDVSLNGVGQRGHGRNRSLSAFGDLWTGLMGKRRSRVSGEMERKEEKEHVEIRSSIETMSEKMSEKT
jgi:hypothetical protein